LRFRDQVTKYLRAKMMMQEQGYDLPMQEFYQKDRGLSWSPTAERDAFVITSDDYNPNAEWPDEKYRFLIVDCQKELKKFYAGVFSVSMAGEIRERYRGEAQSWEELREIQRKHEVKDQRVFVDCGYSMSKVLRQCVQFKHEGWITIGGRKQKHWLCWTGLKGSGREIFQVHNPRTKLMESKIHSVRKFYDVSEGTNLRLPRAPYYEWSNLHCRNSTPCRTPYLLTILGVGQCKCDQSTRLTAGTTDRSTNWLRNRDPTTNSTSWRCSSLLWASAASSAA
jgi:hypothetical protein